MKDYHRMYALYAPILSDIIVFIYLCTFIYVSMLFIMLWVLSIYSFTMHYTNVML